MKLAEALLIGSNMQKKLAQLKCRVNANIKVQEGDTPSEDPNALMVDAPYLSQITNHKSLFRPYHQTLTIGFNLIFNATQNVSEAFH